MNDEVCRILVPENTNDGSNGKLMIARKAQIQGNCRLQEMEIVKGIILVDQHLDNIGDDYSVRNDSCQLGMVRTETAAKYRAMTHFNAKWTVQFEDVIDASMPIDGVMVQLAIGDEFSKEERERFPRMALLSKIDADGSLNFR